MRPDSANIDDAAKCYSSIRLIVVSANRDIIRLLNKINGEKSKEKRHEYYVQLSAIKNRMHKEMTDFEKLQFEYSDACFYVKYLTHNSNGEKIPHEEYYINSIQRLQNSTIQNFNYQ